jgi:hypothetical protein
MTLTGFIYDADSTRLANGIINSWPCDPATNGFKTTNDYILGLGGEQVTEMGVDLGLAGATFTVAGAKQPEDVVFKSGRLTIYDKGSFQVTVTGKAGPRSVNVPYAYAGPIIPYRQQPWTRLSPHN